MILGSKTPNPYHASTIGFGVWDRTKTLEGGKYGLFGSTKLLRKRAKSKGNRFGIGHNAPSDGKAS